MTLNRVNDLKVDELRNLIHDTVWHVLEEMIAEYEVTLELTEETAASLRDYQLRKPKGRSAKVIMQELGLFDDEY